MKNFKRNKWVLKLNGKEIFIPEWIEVHIGLVLLKYKPEDIRAGEWTAQELRFMVEYGYREESAVNRINNSLNRMGYTAVFSHSLTRAGYDVTIHSLTEIHERYNEYLTTTEYYTIPTTGIYTQRVDTTNRTITLGSTPQAPVTGAFVAATTPEEPSLVRRVFNGLANTVLSWRN